MRFYGEAFSQKVYNTNPDSAIKTLCDLYNVIQHCWSKETAYPSCQKFWFWEEPSFGQCAVTAMVVHDMFGGTIHRIRLQDGGTHYFNQINGRYFDLTSAQFPPSNTINYEPNTLIDRAYCGSNQDTQNRFQLLQNNIATFIKKLKGNFPYAPFSVASICNSCINNTGEFAAYRKKPCLCPFEETEKCFDGNPYFIFAKKSNSTILLFSKFNVPFQALSTYQFTVNLLKQELLRAIHELQPQENGYLQARYGAIEEKRAFYDIENILFYNLGTANFNHLATNGVRFSKVDEKEILQLQKKYDIPKEYAHFYEYSIVNSFSEEKGVLLAQWENIPLKCTGLNPAVVWSAVKKNEDRVSVFHDNYCENEYPFALSITIEKPKIVPFKLMTAQKPLLDGLICAFHDSEFTEEEKTEFAALLQCESSLFDSSLGFLGVPKGKYLQKYHNSKSIRWNPADHLCNRVTLSVIEGESWNISGKVFSTAKCPVCKKGNPAKILWGYPAYNEELQAELDQGKTVLGGCCVEKIDGRISLYFCKWCKRNF